MPNFTITNTNAGASLSSSAMERSEQEIDMRKSHQLQSDLYIHRANEAYLRHMEYLISLGIDCSESDTVKQELRDMYASVNKMRNAAYHLYVKLEHNINNADAQVIMNDVSSALYETFGHLYQECAKLTGTWVSRIEVYKKSSEFIFNRIRLTIAGDGGSEGTPLETVSIGVFIERASRTTPQFWQHFPIGYNPVTGRDEHPYTLKMIKKETVVCELTGKPVSKRNAYITPTGFMGMREYEYREDIKAEYLACEYESKHSSNVKHIYHRKDMVLVLKQDASTAYYNVYRPTAEKHFYKCAITGRFFTFDPIEYPCYVPNRGYLSKTMILDGDYTHEPITDTWYKGSFRLLQYNDDVLNHLDGFKGMSYEQIVRGSSVPHENTLFMGMELEVERSRKSSNSVSVIAHDALRGLDGNAIVVSDGSLTDGFEMVSIPATLGYHETIWKPFLRSDIRKHIVSYMRESCGIHIHMSKECFSATALGKFVNFINSPHNTKFIDTIAQRRSGHYCSRADVPVTSGLNRDVLIDKEKVRHGKYTSVNLTKPHTIEVRIFKGTLAFPQVMKNFEFCHALHKYVTFHASINPVKSLFFEHFCSWIKDPSSGNRKMYPYLFDFLCHIGYITSDRGVVGHTSSEDLTDAQAEGAVKGEVKVSMVSASKLAMMRRVNGHKRRASLCA